MMSYLLATEFEHATYTAGLVVFVDGFKTKMGAAHGYSLSFVEVFKS